MASRNALLGHHRNGRSRGSPGRRLHPLGREHLALSLDEERQAVYLGVPASDLDDDGVMRLLIAVGSNTLWNDNLPDGDGVVLELRR